MGLFDFLRSKPAASNVPVTARPSAQPVEQLFAVPVVARKITTDGTIPREKYVFYSFLFADSADAAVSHLRRELRDEGLEFIDLTGPVLTTSISEWTDFVAKRFDWMKDALPTAQQIADGSHGIVYYTPKITQY